MGETMLMVTEGLQIATTAIVAVAVLIVSLACVYQAIGIARDIIDRVDGNPVPLEDRVTEEYLAEFERDKQDFYDWLDRQNRY